MDKDVRRDRLPERTAELRRSVLRINLIRYGGAVASVALATALRFPLARFFHGHNIFAIYFLSVVLSAWLAGWSGGLLAILLSCASAAYFFAPTFPIERVEDQISLLIFVLVGVAICAVSDAQHRAHRQAEKAARTARLHELSLAASESRYQTILESTTDGLLLSDVTGHIVAANPAAAHLLGFADPLDLCVSVNALATKFAFYDLDCNPLPFAEWPLSRALANEKFVNCEVKLRRLDTPLEIYASFSGTPVLDQDGQLPFAVVTLRDITELKQAQFNLARGFEREALLNRIGQAIRSVTDPAEIEAATSQGLCEVLGADRCFFTSIDLPRRILSVQNDWRKDEFDSLSGEYALTEKQAAAVRRLFRRSGTIRIADARAKGSSRALPPLIEKTRCRSLLMVPLYDGPELIAFLTAGMVSEPRTWSAEEVALAEAVAAQSRSAVQAVRIRQKEHWIATMLQEALQPRLPARVGGLELADHYTAALDEASVGGDFYDVFDLEPGLWALVVGDVSGKGLTAAAQVAMVRNMLRGTLYQGRYLSEALTSLNKILTEHDLLKGFVTLFVGVYREQTGTVLHASCGHEPALLYQAATGEVTALEASGPPLGVDAGATYQDYPIRLAPGDSLLMYTDGLSEAGVSRSRILGTDGLRTIFRESIDTGGDIKQARRELIDRVSAFAGGTLHDDACLILARRSIPED